MSGTRRPAQGGGISPEALRSRARAVRALRATLDAWGYVEVSTPCVVPAPALEPHLEAFQVVAGATGRAGALRTSPELALKRVLAAGLPRIYELGPCFRAEEQGDWHGAEFTMLEWYRAGATLADLMDEVEALADAVAHALDRPSPGPWTRRTVAEVMQQATGLDPFACDAATLALHPDDAEDWDAAFFRRWVAQVDPSLRGALFVTDWPESQAALARVRETPSGRRACRFEAYLHGVELANAFLELRDADEQRARVTAAERARAMAGQPPHGRDEAFLDAVGRLPPAAGIALGVDRLVAVIAGWSDLRQGRVERPVGEQEG